MRGIIGAGVFVWAFALVAVPAWAAGDAAAGKGKAMLCAGCHGADGISVSPEVPNLAGQKEAYLVKALKDYRAGLRKNPVMGSIAGGLGDQDIEDLAAFYSRL